MVFGGVTPHPLLEARLAGSSWPSRRAYSKAERSTSRASGRRRRHRLAPVRRTGGGRRVTRRQRRPRTPRRPASRSRASTRQGGACASWRVRNRPAASCNGPPGARSHHSTRSPATAADAKTAPTTRQPEAARLLRAGGLVDVSTVVGGASGSTRQSYARRDASPRWRPRRRQRQSPQRWRRTCRLRLFRTCR